MRTTSRAATELTRPLPLAALGLLALNDHVLKGSGLLPGWLTGKLSDFAGLFLFPILLFGLSSLWTESARERRARYAAMATAIGFALVKLSPGSNALASAWLGPIVLDPSDLLALPMTALAYAWLRRPPPQGRGVGRLGRGLALAATVAACVATSRPPIVRTYPHWQLQHLGARRIGCAKVDAWVSKSSKTGAGITLSLRRAQSGECRAEIRAAALDLSGVNVPASELPAALELDESQRYVYLPFEFDNQALWNEGRRRGRFSFDISATGNATEHVVFAMEQIYEGPHQPIDVPEAPTPPPAETPQIAEGGAPLIMVDPGAPAETDGGPP